MTVIPITLATAAAAALLNIWLASRIGQLRVQHKISVGHGANEALERRMRAQSNFLETTAFFLILLAALEISGNSEWGLAAVAAVFVLARIAHAFGMEGGNLHRWRQVGIVTSFATTVALSVWALICAGEMLLRR